MSKFRHMPFDFSDDDRRDLFVKYASEAGRSRGNNVATFFRATFDAWKDYRHTNEEKFYVGYSPIIAVDADKILKDIPRAHVLHVVRNPWSAYADTKKRPVPLSLERYITAWVTTQHHALVFQKLWPNNIHIVRYEDVIADPKACLGNVCVEIGIGSSESLKTPTWNAKELEEVYPWGTIRRATVEANKATAQELSGDEIEAVRAWTDLYLDIFDYKNFL